MLFNLIEVLKTRIEGENLTYIDKLAGLVTVRHVDKPTSTTSSIQRSYPIYCGLNDQCETSKQMPLIPDHKIKSLFYFEDLRGITVNDINGGFINYTATVRLVGWVNPKKLGSTDCNITAPIQTDLINILMSKTVNSGIYQKIKVRGISIPTKNESIFLNYKYSDKFVTLLDKPYDYFAIDMSIEFSMHKNCASSFIPNTPIEC